MCSQMAFIFCPIILSTVYSFNKEASFYGSVLLPIIASICVMMMLQMPGAKNFGKVGKQELPIQEKPGNDDDKTNDKSPKKSPDDVNASSAPVQDKATTVVPLEIE